MKKNLVIEDNLEIRENICEILELSNYQVLSAENGTTGTQLVMSMPPDLILCDVTMPVQNGFDVLEIVRNNPQTRKIPFVFLTAKSEKTDVLKGLSLGANDYLIKPFDDVRLLEVIENHLE